MQQDNERLVSAMSEEERERHRVEILQQLGTGVEDVLRRIRETRGAMHADSGAVSSCRGRVSCFCVLPFLHIAALKHYASRCSEVGWLALLPCFFYSSLYLFYF